MWRRTIKEHDLGRQKMAIDVAFNFVADCRCEECEESEWSSTGEECDNSNY